MKLLIFLLADRAFLVLQWDEFGKKLRVAWLNYLVRNHEKTLAPVMN
jgi:hypothetical protein